MSIVQVLKFIVSHPLSKKRPIHSVTRFIKWQISSRLMPHPIIYSFVGDTKLIMWRGLTGATGNLYTGLHEFADMAFLLHLLREDDLFADIGANVGSYTVLASGYNKATTISFEPIPKTFEILRNNVAINHIEDRVTSLNIGVGSKPGILRFTSELDTVNHVVLQSENVSGLLEVKVNTLDNVLDSKTPILLKIDVEGFETEVLNGAGNTLSNPGLKAIIIELNSSGNRYGFDDDKIHDLLCSHGFEPYEYYPFERKLQKAKQRTTANIIYIRDFGFVNERISNSPKVSILGQSF